MQQANAMIDGNRLPLLLEQVLGSMVDTLCLVIDTSGVIIFCSPVTVHWLHKSEELLIGQPVRDLNHPLLDIFHEVDWRQRVEQAGYEKVIKLHMGGTRQPVRIRLNRLLMETGQLQGYLFQASRLIPPEIPLLRLRLQRLQELAGIGSWVLNLHTLNAEWSGETRKVIGVGEDVPATLESLLRQVHPQDRERVASAIQTAIKTHSLYDIEYRVMHQDGSVHVVHSLADTVYDEATEVRELIGFVQDVSELKEAGNRLRLSAQLFDSSLNPIVIIDTQGMVQQVNRAFSQATGYLPEDVNGKSVRLLQSHQIDEAFYEYIWHVIETEGVWEGEIWCRRNTGEEFPVWQSITSVRDAGGMKTHYIITFNDITEQKLSADYIYQLAHYDLLTGLPNRVLFSERCRHAIERAKRHGHKTVLLYLDLDRFKQINDSLGHPVGDELLEKVAERLRSQIREEDTVARLGGDEFVIVVEQVTDERDAERIASKMLEALRLPFQLKQHELVISASVGISLSPVDGKDVATLIKHADLAMYRAKEKGRDNFQFYSRELSRASLEYHLLESDLRHARQGGELLLYYQPQYHLQSGRLVGAEALIRWQHKTKGLLSPGKFIPIAEESGLILGIGEWILQSACRQMKQWLDSGRGLERISVNLSGLQIQRGNLVELIRRVLDDSGLPPGCLELEILETYIMRQVEQDVRVLEKLKNLGIRLAIDDFGTGQSSLGYLKRLPVERLKIDRSFVMGIPQDADDVAITRAIVALGKSMQLTVVAEGVENAQQAELLKQLGCDEVQGFYYSPPIDVAQFEQLFNRAVVSQLR
jgi:diguanylate cyclase (GGDEF)-like protein/PAS domain S-box-containing protein